MSNFLFRGSSDAGKKRRATTSIRVLGETWRRVERAMMRTPETKKRATQKRRIFRVVCVLGDGRAVSDCGHDHRTSMAAVRCRYAPRSYERDQAAELRVVAMRCAQ